MNITLQAAQSVLIQALHIVFKQVYSHYIRQTKPMVVAGYSETGDGFEVPVLTPEGKVLGAIEFYAYDDGIQFDMELFNETVDELSYYLDNKLNLEYNEQVWKNCIDKWYELCEEIKNNKNENNN